MAVHHLRTHPAPPDQQPLVDELLHGGRQPATGEVALDRSEHHRHQLVTAGRGELVA